MKKIIITPLLLLVCITGFSQTTTYEMSDKNPTPSKRDNVYYDVHGKYVHPIKKEKLSNAKLLSDILESYPSQWIKAYVSVEVSATHNGKTTKANSKDATLTAEQKNMLSSVELGDNIVINMTYKTENAVTNALENSTMHYAATVVPEIEAEYSSGRKQMIQYLKENAINKIPEPAFTKLDARVKFTVNEDGKIANAQISKTSGDVKVDQLLLEAINNMPKWKPAENANGVKVKQEFEFSVGNGMGC